MKNQSQHVVGGATSGGAGTTSSTSGRHNHDHHSTMHNNQHHTRTATMSTAPQQTGEQTNNNSIMQQQTQHQRRSNQHEAAGAGNGNAGGVSGCGAVGEASAAASTFAAGTNSSTNHHQQRDHHHRDHSSHGHGHHHGSHSHHHHGQQRSKSTSNHHHNGSNGHNHAHHSNREAAGGHSYHHASSSIGQGTGGTTVTQQLNAQSGIQTQTTSTSGRHHHHGVNSSSQHQQRSHSHARGGPTSGSMAATTATSNRGGGGDHHHHSQHHGQQQSQQPKGGHSSGTGSGNQQQQPGNSSRQSSSNAVGHYILGKALGEGTFGKVKLGTHVLTGEKVAVKVLEKSKIKDKKDVERISREIKILKQLHHPNVVQIYEIIETDKDLYLVMEFASGGELFELIVQNQKLKERTASKHLQELLAGVHYIHQLGICHRDLKPENLLIDFDGQLKIVDFGLSNMYERGHTLKTACGSPCYAAPEMIAGNRYHGLKSDIWSCGVVLYAMLCGYLPFEDQKTSNLYKKIMNAEYSLPKFLSNDAKDIISKIFVTDPTKRIDIEGLKQHPWYRLYQPETQNYNFHTMPRIVNEKLVMKLEASLGFSTESVQRAVENNKHNHLSATYYLLLKKYSQANYKSQQAQRNSSVPARVDSNIHGSTTSQQVNISSGGAASKQRSHRQTTQNSDSKSNRPTPVVTNNSQTASDHPNGSKVAPVITVVQSSQSSATTPNSAKLGKGLRTKAIEEDRLKAPVQDQLVLKNHRREQSANATAGRHKRNDDWGNVGDERRTESHDRPGATDDYEIIVCNVKKADQEDGKAVVDGRTNPTKNTTTGNNNPNANLRAHFASPSPDPIGPQATRNHNRNSSSIVNQQHQQMKVNNSSTGASQNQKAQTSEVKNKQQQQQMEVNIHNIKQSFNQQHVMTPSQNFHGQTRATSLPKSAPPKPATYTAATISSTQRSAEKQRQIQKHNDRQASHQAATSHHRKTKSTAPDIVKQISLQPSSQIKDQNSTSFRPLIDQKQVDKSKFSYTQKISNSTKNKELKTNHGGKNNHQDGPSTKVSDLINNMNKQKTYFEMITGKNGAEPTQAGAIGQIAQGAANYHNAQPQKQNTGEIAGIEGSNLKQSETIVNVNKNESSIGIFQSLNNSTVVQRPVIQDINSQNLLKRLESGNSDNQLRQNFVTRQSQQQQQQQQQSKRQDDQHYPTSISMLTNKGTRDSVESPTMKDFVEKRATTIQVDHARNQSSRLSQISHTQHGSRNGYPGQPVVCKTPGNGYQTLDSITDISTKELKIPSNSDTDRGLSKSIFYGTHRASDLNNEMQRYQNEQIKVQSYAKDFSKTQSITMSQQENPVSYHRSNTNQERSNKNVVSQRGDSNTRQQNSNSATHQSKITTQILKQHQRSSTTATNATVGKKSSGGNAASQNHVRQSSSHNGYAIPTQQSSSSGGAAGLIGENHSGIQTKYQSFVSSNQHQQQQDQQYQQQQMMTLSNKIVSSNNQGPTVSKKTGKDPTSNKTRSHSVSGAQKASSQIYTPASHRKGNNSQAGTSLIGSRDTNGHSGHYRSGTAGHAGKERRSSQPPANHNQNSNQNHNLFNGSVTGSQHLQQTGSNPQKQRSSSTNYQSAFLVKSVDNATRQSSVQRNRHKSTRDNPMNSSFVNHLPQDRQFQSITHASGTKTSILAKQLEETIFNQSFNGASISRYHGQATSQATNQNKRKQQQQVASINELLNVAESLKKSHYRPRQAVGNSQQVSESSTTDVRLKKSTLNAAQITQQLQGGIGSSSIVMVPQQPTILLSSQQAVSSRAGQPIIVPADLNINFACNSATSNNHSNSNVAQPTFSSATTPSQQHQAANSTIQSELKASALFPSNHAQQQSQQQQKQSLSAAMRQITDGIMQRQQMQQSVAAANANSISYNHGSQQQQNQNNYHQNQNQPPPQQYLSDLFNKQQTNHNQIGATKKLLQTSVGGGPNTSSSIYSSSGPQQISNIFNPQSTGNSAANNDIHGASLLNQTNQLIGYKSGSIYSPSNRGATGTSKSNNFSQPQHLVEPNSDLLAVSYQHRPSLQQPHQQPLQPTSQNTFYPTQTPPSQSCGGKAASSQQQTQFNSTAGTPNAAEMLQQSQHHQQQIQQQPMVNNLLFQHPPQQYYQSQMTTLTNGSIGHGHHLHNYNTSGAGNNFQQQQQLYHHSNHNNHNMHHHNGHNNHHGYHHLQTQKPPSVPAPSTTAFQHMQQHQQQLYGNQITTASHQMQQHQPTQILSEQQSQQINFYPIQGGSGATAGTGSGGLQQQQQTAASYI